MLSFLPEIRRWIILCCQSPEIVCTAKKKLNAIFVMTACATLLFFPTAVWSAFYYSFRIVLTVFLLSLRLVIWSPAFEWRESNPKPSLITGNICHFTSNTKEFMFAKELGPSKGQDCEAVASFAFTTSSSSVCLESTSCIHSRQYFFFVFIVFFIEY